MSGKASDLPAGAAEVHAHRLGRAARQSGDVGHLHPVDVLHAQDGLLPVGQTVDERQDGGEALVRVVGDVREVGHFGPRVEHGGRAPRVAQAVERQVAKHGAGQRVPRAVGIEPVAQQPQPAQCVLHDVLGLLVGKQTLCLFHQRGTQADGPLLELDSFHTTKMTPEARKRNISAPLLFKKVSHISPIAPIGSMVILGLMSPDGPDEGRRARF